MTVPLLGCPNRKLKGKGWRRGWKCLLAVPLRRTLWKKDARLKIQEQQRTLQTALVARILCPLIQYYGVFFLLSFALHSGTSLFFFLALWLFYCTCLSLLFWQIPFVELYSLQTCWFLSRRNATRCSQDILAAGDLKSVLIQEKNVSCIPVGPPCSRHMYR